MNAFRMHLMKFIVTSHKLPDKFQQVEYIETDGNSWLEIPHEYKYDIKSSVKMQEHTEAKIYVPRIPGNNSHYLLFGFHEGYKYGSGISIEYNNRMYTRTNHNYLYFYQPYPVPFLSEIIIDCDTTKRKSFGVCRRTNYVNYEKVFDENSYNNIFGNEISHGIPYYILKTFMGCRIYYLRRTVYNIKRNDLICVYRKSDHEPGMYDLIHKKFYTNAGSGTFIVGPDVNTMGGD